MQSVRDITEKFMDRLDGLEQTITDKISGNSEQDIKQANLKNYLDDENLRSLLLKNLNKKAFDKFGHVRKGIFTITGGKTEKDFTLLQINENIWVELILCGTGGFGSAYQVASGIKYDPRTKKFTLNSYTNKKDSGNLFKNLFSKNKKFEKFFSNSSSSSTNKNYIVKEQRFYSVTEKNYQQPNKKDLEQLYKAVINEAEFLRAHKVEVRGIILDKSSTFLYMEDCGNTLEEWLRNSNLSVDDLFQIALGISNDYQLLKNLKIYHCDIKPQNICVSENNGQFKVVFIDFGLAIKSENNSGLPGGTPRYMAPELIKGDDPTFASEIYTFGIILEEMFMRKDGWRLPGKWDKSLQEDFIALVYRLKDRDPKLRPSIEYVVKFLSLIKNREVKLEKTNTKIADNETAKALFQLKELCAKNGFTFTENQVSTKKRSIYRDKIVDALNAALKLRPLRHVEVIDQMIVKNDSNNYGDFNITQNIKGGSFESKITALEAQLKILDQFCTQLNMDLHGDKFKTTNSSGIKNLRKILRNNSLTVLEKFERICAVGQAKSNHSISNKLNRLKFNFGLFKKPGRDLYVDLLYQTLAKFNENVNNLSDDTDIFNSAKLKSLLDFIAKENFCHEKEVGKGLKKSKNIKQDAVIKKPEKFTKKVSFKS